MFFSFSGVYPLYHSWTGTHEIPADWRTTKEVLGWSDLYEGLSRMPNMLDAFGHFFFAQKSCLSPFYFLHPNESIIVKHIPFSLKGKVIGARAIAQQYKAFALHVAEPR